MNLKAPESDRHWATRDLLSFSAFSVRSFWTFFCWSSSMVRTMTLRAKLPICIHCCCRSSYRSWFSEDGWKLSTNLCPLTVMADSLPNLMDMSTGGWARSSSSLCVATNSNTGLASLTDGTIFSPFEFEDAAILSPSALRDKQGQSRRTAHTHRVRKCERECETQQEQRKEKSFSFVT